VGLEMKRGHQFDAETQHGTLARRSGGRGLDPGRGPDDGGGADASGRHGERLSGGGGVCLALQRAGTGVSASGPYPATGDPCWFDPLEL
jgi:hypothetical protein